MSRPRIVLTSRELFPFGGGGIGAYVAETARVLAPLADVLVLTASWYRDKHAELVALGDPRVDYGGAAVEFVEVPEPHEYGPYYSHMHLYSHRLLQRLRELYGERPPDIVEFPDYLGEGFIATQARRGGDRFLAETLLVLRLHTSAEMCEVLNGHLERSFERRISREMEARTLRDADVLLHAGGDVLSTYRRYYGSRLAPDMRMRHALGDGGQQPPTVASAAGQPLRLLYVGRCERRKGVQDLISALTSFTADWRLTLLGRDTDTAPLGGSMLRTLELQAAGDGRIVFERDVARAELPARIAAHDAVVMPSRWECWPYVALEAMQVGTPVIATPVGGLRELVRPGVSGWLTSAPGVAGLIETLGPLVAEPERVRAARDPAAICAHARALSDPEEIREGYRELLARRRRLRAPVAATRADPSPLVSIVVPYHRLHRFVAEAVASAFAQSYPRIEVLLVDDGSFEAEDVVLAELATRHPLRVLVQENAGLGAARNFGIAQSRGRYVLPLDADNVLEPTFVARCVELLEADDELAFVTSWNRYVDEQGQPYSPPNEGYRPIGNWTRLVEERNVAGDATAVLRRRVFERHRFSEDLTAFEDWALYRELHHAGAFGHVIPEMLWRYRVREDSMLREVGMRREERLHAEMDALIREREVAWASTSG